MGINLLAELDHQNGYGHEWIGMATQGSQVAEALRRSPVCQPIAYTNSAFRQRMVFEHREVTRIIQRVRPDIVFSQFGTGFPNVPVPAVVGSAYSNLYYPEIDFWGNWPAHRRTLYRFRDRFRLSRTLAADGWIFETDQIAERAKSLFGLAADRVTVVRPSASHAVQPDRRHPVTAARCRALPTGYRILLLTGWHKNKSLDLLPEVAKHLRALSQRVTFVITVPEEHPYSRNLMEIARRLGVDDYFHFFGSVEPDGCVELYRRSDAVLLLSLLESFSNNIIEAWTMKCPLVITDSDWSRGICGPAAMYVDRTDAASVAKALSTLRHDRTLVKRIVQAGHEMRDLYPDSASKLRETVMFLERIHALGPRRIGA